MLQMAGSPRRCKLGVLAGLGLVDIYEKLDTTLCGDELKASNDVVLPAIEGAWVHRARKQHGPEHFDADCRLLWAIPHS